jgi:plastocyanin
MNQNLIPVIALLVIIGGGYYVYSSRSSAPRTPAAPSPAPAATPPAGEANRRQPQTHTVSMNAAGFNPSNLTIKIGDTVVFKNDDTRQHWPASGMHPTHLLCLGFDALRPMASGETYARTFTAAKECPMHDHLIPSLRGKIIVTE